MRRFICKILLISTFFIGLGAIADGVLKAVIPSKREFSEINQIRIIKVVNSSNEQVQFRMILPNIDENLDETIAQKKVKKICPRMNANSKIAWDKTKIFKIICLPLAQIRVNSRAKKSYLELKLFQFFSHQRNNCARNLDCACNVSRFGKMSDDINA